MVLPNWTFISNCNSKIWLFSISPCRQLRKEQHRKETMSNSVHCTECTYMGWYIVYGEKYRKVKNQQMDSVGCTNIIFPSLICAANVVCIIF